MRRRWSGAGSATARSMGRFRRRSLTGLATAPARCQVARQCAGLPEPRRDLRDHVELAIGRAILDETLVAVGEQVVLLYVVVRIDAEQVARPARQALG